MNKDFYGEVIDNGDTVKEILSGLGNAIERDSRERINKIDLFVKHNEGKRRHSLIPVDTIDALAEMYTYGAENYGDNNWKLNEDSLVWYDAMMRHLQSWKGGEFFDNDSGKKHLKHALINMSFLYETDLALHG